MKRVASRRSLLVAARAVAASVVVAGLALQAPAAVASCKPGCGDPTGDCQITAGDALYVLRVAVQLQTCPLVTCDVDDSGKVTAVDALAVLRRAVGAVAKLPCENTTTTTSSTTPSST